MQRVASTVVCSMPYQTRHTNYIIYDWVIFAHRPDNTNGVLLKREYSKN